MRRMNRETLLVLGRPSESLLARLGAAAADLEIVVGETADDFLAAAPRATVALMLVGDPRPAARGPSQVAEPALGPYHERRHQPSGVARTPGEPRCGHQRTGHLQRPPGGVGGGGHPVLRQRLPPA